MPEATGIFPSWFDWITLLAVFIGPILAVFATRLLDEHRAATDRRLDVFKTLMRTRRSPTSGEHVGALNLIEIEYAGNEAVLSKWRDLYTHFGAEHARRADERHEDNTDTAERTRRDRIFDARLYGERQRLLAKLLHSMAKAQKFRIEQLEIFEGGYLPQGWVDLEADQHAIRRFVVDLYEGRRWWPVGVFDAEKRIAAQEQQSVPTAEPSSVADKSDK